MPDHLVALVPLNERASLADFPPFQAAQEGSVMAAPLCTYLPSYRLWLC